MDELNNEQDEILDELEDEQTELTEDNSIKGKVTNYLGKYKDNSSEFLEKYKRKILYGSLLLILISIIFNALQLNTFLHNRKLEKELHEKLLAGDGETTISSYANAVPVLVYQNISIEGGELPKDTVDYDDFYSQMKYLKANDYKTVSLKDLEYFVSGRKKLPPKSIVITFDDGYRIVYEKVYPLLKSLDFKAANFSITNLIGEVMNDEKNKKEIPMLKWRDIINMEGTFEFGAHVHDMYGIASNDDPTLVETLSVKLEEDIVNGKNLLDSKYFAYPDTQNYELFADILKRQGYVMGFTKDGGKARRGDDMYRIPRIFIENDVDIDTFKELLQ